VPTGREAVEGSTFDWSETGILEGSGDLAGVALSVFEEAEHAEIDGSLEPSTASGGGGSGGRVGSFLIYRPVSIGWLVLTMAGSPLRVG